MTGKSELGLYQEPWPSSFHFFQLGYLVDDLRAAAERWVETFNVGPFYFLKRTVQKHIHRGVPTDVDVQLCVTQAGPVQIELIQLFSDGDNVYRDVFPPGGSGLHQLCTFTRDFDGTSARYERAGRPLIAEVTSSAFRVAYFDTRQFGFVTELVEHTPGFVDTVTTLSDICANWDGKDPLRYMTRDGYRLA